MAAGCAYTQHTSPHSLPCRAFPTQGWGRGRGLGPHVQSWMPDSWESSSVKSRKANKNGAMRAQASKSEEEREHDPNKQQNPQGSAA